MEPLRKLRQTLGHREPAEDSVDGDGPIPGISDQVPFNKSARPHDLEGVDDPRTKTEKLKNKGRIVKQALTHPVQAAKDVRAKGLVGELVPQERPWLFDQPKGDEQLFDAHDHLDDARAKHDPRSADHGHDVLLHEAESRVDTLEGQRTQLEVAWHMARYVRRARVVRGPLSFPPRERYRRYDQSGRYQGTAWVKWIGHLTFYGLQNAALPYIDPTNTVPYEREDLIRAIERLLIVSDAFQYWWMRVRHIYRWEEPWLTFKWLMLYFALLKTGYFMTFFWAYLIYSVVKNRDGSVARGWMRSSTDRAKGGQRAAMISEMIARHGEDGWFDAMLQEFGPWLQEQLMDLAQFLEISNSYYIWRDPTATWYSVVGYATLFLVGAITDLQFSMKLFWLSAGMWFFMSRPISSLYPRFRHVVDPVRWFLWHQPTTTEFCFRWLRGQALGALDDAPSNKPWVNSGVPTVDEPDELEVYFDCISSPPSHAPTTRPPPLIGNAPALRSFAAHWSGRRGTLEVTRGSARFVTHGGRNRVEWERSLASLLEVRKLNLPLTDLPTPSATKLLKTSAAISIVWLNEDDTVTASTEEQTLDKTSSEEETMYAMHTDARDEVFNTLIGVSGALWMELQSQPGWQTKPNKRPSSNERGQ